MRELGVFSFFLRERYPSKLRRGESITPTSACLPTASPLHLQHIPPSPVIVEASSRKQPPQFMRIRRHFYTLFAVLQNFSYLFQISSMYYSQRQWRIQEILQDK